jgi:hypothetical protein
MVNLSCGLACEPCCSPGCDRSGSFATGKPSLRRCDTPTSFRPPNAEQRGERLSLSRPPISPALLASVEGKTGTQTSSSAADRNGAGNRIGPRRAQRTSSDQW